MSEMTYEETLAHFGVKGMRWGVRNQPERTTLRRLEGGKVTDKVKITGRPDKDTIKVTRQKSEHSIPYGRVKGTYPKTDAERKAFIQDFAKKYPAKEIKDPTIARVLAKNGKKQVLVQLGIGALTVPALIATAPATATAVVPASFMAVWSAGQSAALGAIAAGGLVTVKDLIGVRASKKEAKS